MKNIPIQKKDIDIKNLKAAIYLKYGYELDDTSIIILYILTDNQSDTFSEQNKKIDIAIEKINDSQRSLHVDREHPRWQAFWFGFGKLGLSLLIAVTIVAVMWIFYMEDKKENRPAKLEWYKNYYFNTKGLTPKQADEYILKNPIPEDSAGQ